MIAILLFLPSLSHAETRTTADLLTLYDFSETSGTTIHDRAGNPPLDLTINSPKTVRWAKGGLVIDGSASIASKDNAKKVIDAIKGSNALTIEAWIKPADADQKGPARIVSLSSDPSHRNFTLGQEGAKIDVRLRAESTNENGLPSVASPEKTLQPELTHVIYTRDAAGEARIYLNGKLQASGKVAGSFKNWSGDFRLLLANELTNDRPWRGELHLVALYSRALSEKEVAQNFAAGSPKNAIDYTALLPPAADRQIDFAKDVQPILRQHCFECHAEGNEEGGLNLGVKVRALEGGDSGAIFVAKKSAESRLMQLASGLDKEAVMPPETKGLSRDELGILRAWIDQGADWPNGHDVLNPRIERAQKHWAFQSLRDVPLPAVRNEKWCETSIDRFILAKLEAQQIAPTRPADPRTLARRVYFDMLGLPPTPEELDAFVAASQKDSRAAYHALVEKLLASPHYGERFARDWLDVARYADSEGQEGDQDRPHAWRYRDFVIESFNSDRPFDEFLRWQLAGDEYEPNNPTAAVATGFLTAGPHTVLENTFLEEERLRNRYNELDDMLSTIGTGMLGLTIGCARCHDHKYDAISAREYYRLLAALHSGDRQDVKLGNKEALVFRDFGSEPKPTWLFGRANFYDRNRPVTLGFLEILQKNRTAEEYWKAAKADSAAASTYQRRALAEWLTDVERGAGALAARVIVNRLWQHHFGDGLVRTPGDFGVRSEPPTHPELLDWLARDFVAHGWKIKRLQQLILTSAVYQQAATFDAAKAKMDPENRLLGRMKPQRLSAEALRDALLAVSGSLNDQTYGAPFKAPIDKEANVARNLKTPYPDNLRDGPENHRRTIYMFHKRVVPYPLLQAFDRPDSLQSCSRRDKTTVAPQALALLNDPFVRLRAVDFAERLKAERGKRLEVREARMEDAAFADPKATIRRAFELALGRAPRDSEAAAAAEFLAAAMERRKARAPKASAEELQRQALADFCQSLFGLNEFIYVD